MGGVEDAIPVSTALASLDSFVFIGCPRQPRTRLLAPTAGYEIPGLTIGWTVVCGIPARRRREMERAARSERPDGPDSFAGPSGRLGRLQAPHGAGAGGEAVGF